MRRHDRRDLRLDRRAKRHELDLLQPVGRMLDEGQFDMRIGARVAMPGKVLAARRDPFGLQRLDNHAPQPRHVVGPPGERAIADDGVRRVREDVEDRRVVQRDPDRRELGRQGQREPLRQALVATPAERHHWRPHRER